MNSPQHVIPIPLRSLLSRTAIAIASLLAIGFVIPTAKLRAAEDGKAPSGDLSVASTILRGRPLPDRLAKYEKWGPPDSKGLRAVWKLRDYPPRPGQVHESRVYFHNSGNAPLLFKADTWHQSDPHSIRVGEKRAVSFPGPSGKRLLPMDTIHLEPGEYCEVTGHDIAVGPGNYDGELTSGSIGAVIDAAVGDLVRFASNVVVEYISASDGLVDPDSPRAAPRIKLSAGEFRVRVGPSWGAGNAPRHSIGPGRYLLGKDAHLLVTQFTRGGKQTCKALIHLPAVDTEPYEIALPDDGIYGFGWRRDSGILYLLTRGAVNKFDFTVPGRVTASALRIGEIEESMLNVGLVDGFNRTALAASESGTWPLPSGLIPGASAKAGDPESRELAAAARKLYWGATIGSEGLDYNPGAPFDPDELDRLAKAEDTIDSDGPAGREARARDRARRLSWLISRAGAENATRFRYLLTELALREIDDPHRGVALALAGYDYSVNGNRKALQAILDSLAEKRPGADAQELIPLAFINEWAVTIAAYKKHFSRGTDGAGGLAADFFWLQRQCLFPDDFDRYQAELRKLKTEQDGAGQPATRSETK